MEFKDEVAVTQSFVTYPRGNYIHLSSQDTKIQIEGNFRVCFWFQ